MIRILQGRIFKEKVLLSMKQHFKQAGYCVLKIAVS